MPFLEDGARIPSPPLLGVGCRDWGNEITFIKARAFVALTMKELHELERGEHVDFSTGRYSSGGTVMERG